MSPQTNATCNTCGGCFIAQNGHTCPLTITHRTANKYQTQRDESLLVNGIPVGHKSFTDQRNTSESVSSFSHNIHSFPQQPSTSSQYVPLDPNHQPYNQFTTPHYNPPPPKPPHSQIPALQYNPYISTPSMNQSSIRPIDDDGGETRIWLRGGGGSNRDSDDGSLDFSHFGGAKKKGKDLYITFPKGQKGKKDFVLHKKRY